MDSTFIEAPSSTKNQRKEHDTEAHSAKKGNTWHFGYKAHIGVDRESSLVHHVDMIAANDHDVTAVSRLMHGEEETLHGDSVYIGAQKRPDAITRNKKARRSNISFAENRLQFKSYQKAVNMPPKKQNTRSHRSAARLNTFLQL